MDSTPSRSGTGLAVIALLLILAPGVGALLGTMLHSEQFTVTNLVLSPAFALAAGILLGIRTGDSAGAKALHSLLWTMGALGVSIGLQSMGCRVFSQQIQPRPGRCRRLSKEVQGFGRRMPCRSPQSLLESSFWVPCP